MALSHLNLQNFYKEKKSCSQAPQHMGFEKLENSSFLIAFHMNKIQSAFYIILAFLIPAHWIWKTWI